jgi:hypothetical protein
MCARDRACDAAGRCQMIATTMAKFYGVVFVAARRGGATTEETVSGAAVAADSGEITRADRAGNFELLLTPGEHTLIGSAPGLTSGTATCRAGAGGAVECSIVLGGEADEGDMIEVRGQCAAARTASGPALLLLLLGLLAGRRSSR